MQVEDVTWVCFTARWAAQQKGHGTVGFSLLREVIEDDEDVLAAVHPVLTDCGTRIWCEVLEACGVGCWGSNDGGVLHRAVLFQGGLHSRDRGRLLADCDVDATDLLGDVTGCPVFTLVQDGVDRDGGLTGLAVANDQLTLATADRDHRVDRLQAGLQRLINRLTLGHRWSLQFKRATAFSLDLALIVNWLTQRVNYTAQEFVTDWHGENLSGAVDLLALFNTFKVTQDNNTDFTAVQVLGQAQGSVFKTNQFVRHHGGKTLYVGNAVSCRDNVSDLYTLCGIRGVGLCEAVECVTDFLGIDGQLGHLPLPAL